MTVRLWNEGDTLCDLSPMVRALLARCRERVARRRAPLTRTHGPVADTAKRAHVQVDEVYADPDRRNGDTVLHILKPTAAWTCPACGSLVPSRLVLRLVPGESDD